MSTVEAVNLGIIQGITEWLPVSSSGHLALYQHIVNLDVPLIFDVLLHFSSLAVIIVVFRKRIIEILKSSGYIFNIILGSIPIALAGYFARDLIEVSFSNMKTVSAALLITGFMLFATRFRESGTGSVRPLSSLIIGLSQAFALFPGISRSGATISTGMLSGINREKAAEFSFILAIPAILGATAFEIFQVESVEKELVLPLITGMIVSFTTGYFSLKLLLRVVKRGKLSWFSFYCIALGLLLIAVSRYS